MESKFVVCPCCEGEGTLDDFGSFTSSDLDEWYGDSYERDEFIADYRAGRIGRKSCGFCHGQRVVPAVDADGVEAEEAWRIECDLRDQERAEMRYAGIY